VIDTTRSIPPLTNGDREKRIHWWLSESPPIVERIASYLEPIGFGVPHWSANQLDISFFRPRGLLLDEIQIGAKSEGVFSSSFAIRSEGVSEIEKRLNLVTSATGRPREIQIAALLGAPRALVYSDLRGLAPATAGGISHQESYVTAIAERVEPALRNWTLLIEQLWPIFFDVFQSPRSVVDFLLGHGPDALMPILKRDPSAIIAGNGHVRRYLLASILATLDGDPEIAALALKYFASSAQSQYGNEQGRGTELLDARRYVNCVTEWMSIAQMPED
jgi:hypothetical protein